MRGKRLSIGLRAALAIFTVTLLVTSTWAATPWKEKVLYSFGNGPDGDIPNAGLILDAAGNLYGTTTVSDGIYGPGVVFELTPTAGGGWTEKVLYNFCSQNNCTDGSLPYASLIFDAAGNLYGTTAYGGDYGSGTAFELTPTAGGGWAEKVLYSFGGNPFSGLIFDAAGNLYGTTYWGGTYGQGTAFELTPTPGGGWTETVLHSFILNGTDGAYPYAGLIFDAAGNLYGTTYWGGTWVSCGYGCGTVYELTPAAGGDWTETVLHSFGIENIRDPNGYHPGAGLIFDAAGNLYGTTQRGDGTGCGGAGCGTVFELTPTAGGGWTEKVLHGFGNGTDGAEPYAGLIFDVAGDLYGTTTGGGDYGHGTVFELAPTAGGDWTETVLYSFGNGTDGANPDAGLIFDKNGSLYGTTTGGGTYGGGTVFELSPVYPCARCSHIVSSGEVDVLPAERRDVLEQGGTGRP
jgi:uncharacterized repeat protein (TIGR03803 family)